MSRDRPELSPMRRARTWHLPPAMTDFDQQRIASWIGDAFAILCVRAAGGTVAERKVRLGFETILRELRTPPLRIIARAAPPAGRLVAASTTDWRQILHALERCRTAFTRYDASLNASERRIRDLIETTRHFAQEELRLRSQRRPRAATSLSTPAVASTREMQPALAAVATDGTV